MVFATKILWGIVAVGACGTAVYYFSGSTDSWSPLSQDAGFGDEKGTEYSGDVFGKSNAKYLLGLDARNAPWWDVLLKRLNDDVASDSNIARSSHDSWDGKVIVTGYGINPQTSLNKVCEKSYKTASSDVEGASGGPSSLKKSEIFRYCSPIKTLSLAGEIYSNVDSGKSIGETSKDSLLSTNQKVNETVWESLTEEFFKESGKGSGSEASSGSLFKTFYDENKKDKPSIKKVCDEAYKKPASDTANSNDAKKFCTVY